MSTFTTRSITIGSIGIISLLCISVANAQDYVELVGVPYLDNFQKEGNGLAGYANSLYLVAISIAAILAVLKIVIAGVKYMMSDIIPTKGQAKKDIQNALLGLLVVVGAFLILDTINPNLTNLKMLDLTGLKAELKPYEINQFQGDYYGPTTCEEGESLIQRTESGRIIRECVANADNPNIDLPDESDLLPGENLIQKNINIPCANPSGCNSVNGYDNLAGIESARSECEEKSDGLGEFTQTSITQGICSWPD